MKTTLFTKEAINVSLHPAWLPPDTHRHTPRFAAGIPKHSPALPDRCTGSQFWSVPDTPERIREQYTTASPSFRPYIHTRSLRRHGRPCESRLIYL